MPESIGELIERFLAGQLGDKAPTEARLWQAWQRLMGPDIAAATARITLQRHTCVIYVKDPVLREELRYQANAIVELLRAADFPQLKRIRFITA